MPMNVMRRNDAEALDAAGNKKIPLVSIVILNWNGKNFLEKFISSIVASTYPNKRVIVADNASTDASIEFLKTNYPQVEIIQNDCNGGYAKGYNTALKQIQSDYYVLLNNDIEVIANWIEPVIELMESDSAIAACQPKILSCDNKYKFEYAGASGGWVDNFGYPFTRGRIFDFCEEDNGQYNMVQQCFWASGAALFVKANMYHEMKGLDEYFFAHQEEIDLCWRLQLAGYKIFVQPASVVYHVGGGTLSKSNSRKTFLNFRNNLIMLAKNLPVGSAFWRISIRYYLDMLSAIRALFQGNGNYFLAVCKAYIHFIGWMLFFRKRSVFPIKKSNKVYGWYKGCIACDYFIRKKKTFLEIVGNK